MLDYPFDSAMILRKKNSLKSLLTAALGERGGVVHTRIAILGGSTTNHIADTLELFLLDQGIVPTFWQCDYGRYYEEILYPSGALHDFHPDFIYFHTSNRNITAWPRIVDDNAGAGRLLEAEFARFASLWERAAADYGCTIIQNNFELPDYRLQGNRDAADRRGAVNFVTRLNLMFADYAASHTNFYLNDINYLSALCGLDAWNDPNAWALYKYSPAPGQLPALCHSVASIVKSTLGRNKKALVLDLDNTLWGGVVGDDGVEGIEIGQETATGQTFRRFQQYLRELASQGVLLTVNSKNDYTNALAGLGHPASVLRPEDFIVLKANWQNKDRNLLEIAQELNLLPDSLVFVDDNPAERAIVTAMGAGVAVPEMGQPEDYIRVLDRSGFFEVTNLSADDLRRTEMYKENAQRTQLETQCGNYEDYLLSLEMTAKITPFTLLYLPRIAQLTNKSNQFNLTTLRCTLAEIEQTAGDRDKITLCGTLSDRFGDNGVVSVIMGNRLGDTLDITLWLMSCRVLKRGMEDAMLDALVRAARGAGLAKLRGHYYPTAKNSMVQDFYTQMGFALVERAEDGTGLWELPLRDYTDRNTIIKVGK